MHLIPWALLKEAIGFNGDRSKPDTTVTMTNQVFRLLMEAAVKSQPFDEAAYLAANPDVAAGVKAKLCPDARAHYVASGYYEGRPAGSAAFDEAWYVSRYADVKRALLLGQSASGHEHFAGPGVREWRSPNAAAEPDIARWRHAVTEAGSKDPHTSQVATPAASAPATAKAPPPRVSNADPGRRARQTAQGIGAR